jgi:chemotaxis protein MotB
MRKRRRKIDEEENVDRWMIPYADFVTLLFCFFTAMYAISNVDTNKLGKFVESMRTAFHITGSRGNAFSIIEGVQIFVPTNIELESDIKEAMGILISKSKGGINVKRDKRGVIISVVDKFFFESASAALRDGSRDVLDKISLALNKSNAMIRIEGHTDNIPMSNGRFPSNWELSASRAINVAKYFIENHDIQPGRIATTGYSSYKPVASNDTPEGRSKNRRVDIVILNEAESRKEPL